MKEENKVKTITITFIMDPFTFTYLWSIFSKQGGNLNELLVDYYIKTIEENYPETENVIPKIFIIYQLLGKQKVK